MWAWIDEQWQRQTSFEQVGKNETQESEKEKKSVRKTSAGATKFSFFCEENHFWLNSVFHASMQDYNTVKK